tara:strand:- start:81 stop:326 length:246 start_codon:yes stop_codon:yes gene_type:complete
MKISTKLNIKVILKLIFLNFFLSNSAYAYLDPGTGSFILQAIIAFFAAALAFMSGAWIKIKMFFEKLLKINKKKNKDNKAE